MAVTSKCATAVPDCPTATSRWPSNPQSCTAATRVAHVGTGVGLALVGRLAGRLGGEASAGHAPEGGLAFRSCSRRQRGSARPRSASTCQACARSRPNPRTLTFMDKRWQRMRAPIATGVAGSRRAPTYAVDPSTPGTTPAAPRRSSPDWTALLRKPAGDSRSAAR